jgi:acyl carrier protein
MLPEAVTTFLKQAAETAHTDLPAGDASLFKCGVLDSFSLVDLVALLENEYGIRISDSDLRPERFDTIAKIEILVERLKSAGAGR